MTTALKCNMIDQVFFIHWVNSAFFPTQILDPAWGIKAKWRTFNTFTMTGVPFGEEHSVGHTSLPRGSAYRCARSFFITLLQWNQVWRYIEPKLCEGGGQGGAFAGLSLWVRTNVLFFLTCLFVITMSGLLADLWLVQILNLFFFSPDGKHSQTSDI